MSIAKRAPRPKAGSSEARKASPVRSVVTGKPTFEVADFYATAGSVKVETAARLLGISNAQLLEAAGARAVHTADVSAPIRLGRASKARLREMLEIVGRISTWAGGREQALAWYRAQPIPAFGSRTAEALVKEGKAAAVRDYLDHVAVGGFA